jgi:hypothetical protein
MKTHHLEPTLCPHCGYMLDAASNIDGDRAPTTGDVTICINCTNICLYETATTLRVATKQELLDNFEPEQLIGLLNIQQTIREHLQQARRPGNETRH